LKRDVALDVALLRSASVPFGVGIVPLAEPLATALAELLAGVVTRLIHARDSLTELFLRLYRGRTHNFLQGTKERAGRKGKSTA
jgi:hypothetical protein